MKKEKFLPWAIILFLIIGGGVLPAESKISGEIFGDYYAVLNQHNQPLEKQHGFWFRRVFVTYDNELTSNIKMRFQLEMRSPGDFATKSLLTAAVKSAYLSWEKGRHAIFLGIIPTPGIASIEEYWCYRTVERTPFDLQGMQPTRDFGISAKGTLDAKKKFFYFVLFGNGSSNQSETNKGKRVYATLNWKAFGPFCFEVYGDYEKSDDPKSFYLIQGLAGAKWEKAKVGLLYGARFAHQRGISGDKKTRLLSLFGNYQLGKDLEALLRLDRMFDPNANAARIEYCPMADNAAATILFGGVSWQAAKNVKVIPNVMAVFYDQENGVKIDPDFYAKLTFAWKW